MSLEHWSCSCISIGADDRQKRSPVLLAENNGDLGVVFNLGGVSLRWRRIFLLSHPFSLQPSAPAAPATSRSICSVVCSRRWGCTYSSFISPVVAGHA